MRASQTLACKETTDCKFPSDINACTFSVQNDTLIDLKNDGTGRLQARSQKLRRDLYRMLLTPCVISSEFWYTQLFNSDLEWYQ